VSLDLLRVAQKTQINTLEIFADLRRLTILRELLQQGIGTAASRKEHFLRKKSLFSGAATR
jgi:hypothetical protein